jgi:hypothetical protein
VVRGQAGGGASAGAFIGSAILMGWRDLVGAESIST